MATSQAVAGRSTGKHYIFGYGSLLCSKSRALTAPRLAFVSDEKNSGTISSPSPPSSSLSAEVLPVVIHNVERSWTARGMEEDVFCLTYVSLLRKIGSKCAGVLFEVSEDELQLFDKREGGYDRILVDANDVDLNYHYQMNYSNSSSNTTTRHTSTTKFHSNMASKDSRIWMYLHSNPKPASSIYPIAQSYVDVILRGALAISEEFARSFLETTHGWHVLLHEIMEDYDNNNNHKSNGNQNKIENSQHYVWIDDRHKPQYVRADPEYSLRMSHHLDRLLKEHQRDAFAKRVRI